MKKLMRYTLQKKDRLTMGKDIEQVFKHGHALYNAPIKLVYDISIKEESGNVQCGFLVSKKYFLKANKRNRIKRLMKTCYRLQKHQIHCEKPLKMMMIYTDKKMVPHQIMFEKINHLLSLLQQRIG